MYIYYELFFRVVGLRLLQNCSGISIMFHPYLATFTANTERESPYDNKFNYIQASKQNPFYNHIYEIRTVRLITETKIRTV